MFLDFGEKIAIVLVRPKYPENIGFVARTALNMGLSQLVVVCDERPDESKMMKTATHNARSLVESIHYHAHLKEALADFHMALGTTARKGRHRRAPVLPRDLAALVAPVLAENRVALVFGPEDRGLVNDELALCGYVTSIATADFASLNLSHAVAIVCHEIFQGLSSLGNLGEKKSFSPRLATVCEQLAMVDTFQQLFAEMDALTGKEKGKKRLQNLQSILARRDLQAKESRLLSEISRELTVLLRGLEKGRIFHKSRRRRVG